MKFAKHLAQRLDTFSIEEYRALTVPYKRWKKVAADTTMPSSHLEELVEKACTQIDKVFRKHWAFMRSRRRRVGGPCFSCAAVVHPHPDPHELLEFATLNTTAIYKICKKWRKQGLVAPELYYKLRDKQRFAFMGSGELTLLKMAAESPEAEAELECPICLDAPEQGVVMACGHWMCWTCLNAITHLEKINATTHNRLLIASWRFNCPMCRATNPLRWGERGLFRCDQVAD